MERKLASIQIIDNLAPIPGADRIEVASVLGWKSVVKKGEFAVGDKIVYCEIDSILPSEPQFDFLKSSNYRIRTAKLRGQVSQGICFPLSILTGRKYPTDTRNNLVYTQDIGTDVTGLLGIKKYEPPCSVTMGGEGKGLFPSFIPKTDEIRIQSIPGVLARNKGAECYISEKIDGCSVSFFLNKNEFGVCSRNIELKEGGNIYWRIAKEMEIEKKMRTLSIEFKEDERDFAIQGEIYGFGIQGNPLKLIKTQLAIYSVFSISKGMFYSFAPASLIAHELNLCFVPYLGTITLNHTIDELVLLATRKSSVNHDVPCEGIVVRTISDGYDEEIGGRLSFKVINPEYLLKMEK